MSHNRDMNTAPVRRFARTPRPLLTPLMLAALGIVGGARAQDGQGPSTRELIERIEKLEASNRALAGEVQTLRASEGQAWLTEERAAEIRSIVADVLADSESRNSLQSSGATAGWNDGFFLQSADGRFRLQVGGLVQMRYTMSYIPDGQSGVQTTPGTGMAVVADNVEVRSGFDLPATQLNFDGHIFGEQYQYRIKAAFSNADEAIIGDSPLTNQGSGGGTFRLLDAYMRIQLDNEFALRVGQFKLPYAREQMLDDEYTLGVARSNLVEHLGLGRSQGIELDWTSDNMRAMIAYSNGGNDNLYGILKAVGSEPMNSVYWADQIDWAFTGRMEWKLAGTWQQFNSMTSPPGDEFAMLTGIAGHAQSGDPEMGTTESQNPPNEWYGFTADVTTMYGGATFFGSLFYNSTDSGEAYVAGANNFGVPQMFNIGGTNVWGFSLQGSYYVAPKWEVFGRYEWGNASIKGIDAITTPATASTLDRGNAMSILTVGINWYIDGEDLKWSNDVGFGIDSVDGVWWNGSNGWRASSQSGEVVFRSQLQFKF